MNTKHIHQSDHKFLLQSVRICQAIDPYVETLGLNPKEVEFFKAYVQSMLYIAHYYKSFASSYFSYNIDTMRGHLSKLECDCLLSVNYTKSIGTALGIDGDAKFNSATFPELDFYVCREN